MGLTEAISSVFSKFATFSGRASRSEYWYWVLFFMLFPLIDLLIAQVSWGLAVFAGIVFGLISIIPNLAVQVRRLHDTGHSGWCLLLSFIPIIGAIILFVFYVTDSQPGSNQYGPNPKEIQKTRRPATNKSAQNSNRQQHSYGASLDDACGSGVDSGLNC